MLRKATAKLRIFLQSCNNPTEYFKRAFFDMFGRLTVWEVPSWF